MDETPFDRLGRELDAAAARRLGVAPASRRRRRWTGLLAVLIATPVLAATAWAASALLSTGSPVSYRDGMPVSGVGVGAPVAGSVRMLTTTVRDPDGGLNWGLRSFRTTRGLVCLQIGRVYRGRLGVLGRDGSFRNDGRFHELRAGIVASPTQCFPPDGAGHAYLTLHFNDYLPSGEPCRRRSCLARFAVGGPPAPRPVPSLATRRSVDFGLLGPNATSITYRSGTGTRTMRLLGPEGGYLIVRRPLKPPPVPKHFRRDALAGFLLGGDPSVPAMTPTSRVITRVQYGSLARCNVRHPRPGRLARSSGGCPDPPGFVPIAQAEPGDVRTRVTARAVGRREIRVRFIARVAVRDRFRAYNVMVYPPRPRGTCCRGAIGDTTDRNIPAGRTIVKDVALVRRPPGRYRVVVSLVTQAARPSPGGNLYMVLPPGPGGRAQHPGARVGRTVLVVR